MCVCVLVQVLYWYYHRPPWEHATTTFQFAVVLRPSWCESKLGYHADFLRYFIKVKVVKKGQRLIHSSFFSLSSKNESTIVCRECGQRTKQMVGFKKHILSHLVKHTDDKTWKVERLELHLFLFRCVASRWITLSFTLCLTDWLSERLTTVSLRMWHHRDTNTLISLYSPLCF